MDDLISVAIENGLMLIKFVRPKLRNPLSVDVLDALAPRELARVVGNGSAPAAA